MQQKELLLMQQKRFDAIEKLMNQQFNNLHSVRKQEDIDTKRKALEEALEEDSLCVTVAPRQMLNFESNSLTLLPQTNQCPLNDDLSQSSLPSTIEPIKSKAVPTSQKSWITSVVEE